MIEIPISIYVTQIFSIWRIDHINQHTFKRWKSILPHTSPYIRMSFDLLMAHNSAHHSILIDVLQMITSKGRKLLSAAKPGGLMAWGRHKMETFSALLAICEGNSPVPGEFPAQRLVTRSLDVFMDLHPNKRLGKQWWGWWFETQSCPIWRHRNDSLKHGSWQVLILRNVRRNSLKMVSNLIVLYTKN